MTKLDSRTMREILAPGVPAGESLQHVAYGVRQPNMLLMLPAFALAVVPGVLLTQKLTKHYVVGATRNYLVIAEVSPKWRSLAVAVDAVKSVDAISLGALRGEPKKVSTGPVFTHIRFGAGKSLFKVKFHRAFSKTNRAEANAIAEIVAAQVDRRTRARN
jgi:hypothetical protein